MQCSLKLNSIRGLVSFIRVSCFLDNLFNLETGHYLEVGVELVQIGGGTMVFYGGGTQLCAHILESFVIQSGGREEGQHKMCFTKKRVRRILNMASLHGLPRL